MPVDATLFDTNISCHLTCFAIVLYEYVLSLKSDCVTDKEKHQGLSLCIAKCSGVHGSFSMENTQSCLNFHFGTRWGNNVQWPALFPLLPPSYVSDSIADHSLPRLLCSSLVAIPYSCASGHLHKLFFWLGLFSWMSACSLPHFLQVSAPMSPYQTGHPCPRYVRQAPSHTNSLPPYSGLCFISALSTLTCSFVYAFCPH